MLYALDPNDLVVIPMAFTSLGALHPNYRATYKSWALRWATFGEGPTLPKPS